MYAEHVSVSESRRLQTEPIDLDTCLKAFTKEEELGEDELYYCSKCKDHRLAAKKLEIWRLPPILVRFLYCLCVCVSVSVCLSVFLENMGLYSMKKEINCNYI